MIRDESLVSGTVVSLFKQVSGGEHTLGGPGIAKAFDIWGITGMASHYTNFLEAFARDERDEADRPVLALLGFNDFVTFFMTIKATFSKFQRNEAVHASDIDAYLKYYEYTYSKDSLDNLYKFFDADGSGLLEIDEILLLHLSLYNIESRFLKDEASTGSIDLKKVQAILRSLKICVTSKETEILFKKAPAELTFDMNFEKFVALVMFMQSQLEVAREEAKVMLQANKVRPTYQRNAVELSDKAKQDLAKSRSDAKMAATRIISSLRPGEKWEDRDFPATSSVLFPSKTSRGEVVKTWCRPGNLVRDPALFQDGVDQGDVMQGCLEDCYLLSALTLLASSEASYIQDIFVGEYPEHGFYQCRFFKNDEWMIVTIDDRLPLDHNNHLPFSHCADPREFWTPLLEKAYAKLHGSYESIESGSIADALVDLTGEVSEIIPKIQNNDTLWDKMILYEKKGYFMGCSMERDELEEKKEHLIGEIDANDEGIIWDHAYSILQVVEVYGVRLLRLRNPWGHYEWNGAWSDNAQEWTAKMLDILDFSFSDDGTFFMEFCDWCLYFNRAVSLIVMNSEWDKYTLHDLEWKGETAGGCINHPTWMNNPQVKFTVDQRCQIFISLQQYDSRYEHHKHTDYPTTGIMVLARDQNDDYKQEHLDSREKVAALSQFLNIRESSVTFRADARQPYTVVFNRYLPNVPGKFIAHICAESCPLQVVELSMMKPKTTVKGEWKGASAGGCPNWLTWHNCPQFLLHLQKSNTVTVTIVQERKPTMAYIGFHIYPANDKKMPVLDPQAYVFQAQYLNGATVSSHVKLDAGYYNLVAATFDPGFEGKFGVVVQGEGASLTEMKKWQVASIHGNWTLPDRAGGCNSGGNTDWPKNPKVWFRIQQPRLVNIGLEVEQNSPIRGIGFYVHQSDDSKSIGKLVGKCAFKTEKEVTTSLQLPAGCYIIIACTHAKGVEGPHKVIVYTEDSPIVLQDV